MYVYILADPPGNAFLLEKFTTMKLAVPCARA